MSQTFRRTAAKGLRHGKARLRPEQVADILRRYEPGQNRWRRGNATELAAEYGIARNYVPLLAKGGHWSMRMEAGQ